MSKLFRSTTIMVSILVMASMALASCAAPTASPTVVNPTAPTAVLPVTGGFGTDTPAPATPPAATATTAPAAAAVKNPDTIVEANIGDISSLDPAWAYDVASGEVIFNVYETLLFPKRESPTDFVPMLATSWDISADNLTYTFHIRQGVKFQDGEPLTPEDVAYSFWRGMIQDRASGPQWIMLEPFFGLNVQTFQDDVVNKQFAGNFANAAKAVEQAITFDNNAGTVTLHLKQPYGPMLQILTGSWASIVSKPWVIKQGGWDGTPETAEKFHDPAAEKDELFKVMNGTGPYQFSRWAPGEEVDLVRNDNYWVTTPLWDGGPSGPAKTKNIIIKEIGEWGTRFATFKTGDADILYVDNQYISQIDPLVKDTCDATGKCSTTNASGSFRLFKGLPSIEETVVFFNEKANTTGGNNMLGSGKIDGNGIPADFFSDINIRQAFNYAFDWDTYIKQVWQGEAIQGFGPIIQGELGYDPNQAHYTFDLTKAADAFKASTWKSADGKSLWDTGFYMQYTYNTGNDQRKTAGEILAASLQKINPKFHLAVVDEPFALLLKDQADGRMPIFMLGWQEDYHDPQDWVGPFLASGGTYAGTQSFPKDVQTQLDTLINQGVKETDTAKRAAIYSQLQDLTYKNALDLFVVQAQTRWYFQESVNGYYYNPIYPGFYFYSLSKGS
jgi:peptide/nickel transport system substrate-binding protein